MLERTFTTSAHRLDGYRLFTSIMQKYQSGGIRMWFVRHGESLANVQPEVYREMPDHAIPLTERGHDMAREAGRVRAPYVL